MRQTDPLPSDVAAPYGSNANGPAYSTPEHRERLHRESVEAIRRELEEDTPPSVPETDPPGSNLDWTHYRQQP